MSFEGFEIDMRRLLSTTIDPICLAPDISLRKFDSMTLTEVCIAAEEHLDVELTFTDARACETYGELRELLVKRSK